MPRSHKLRPSIATYTQQIDTMIKAILACMLASATAFVAPVSNVASSVSLRAVPEIASAISTLRVVRVPARKTPRPKRVHALFRPRRATRAAARPRRAARAAAPRAHRAAPRRSVADLPTLVAPTEGQIGGFIDSGLFALFFAVSIIGGLPLLVYLRLASLEE